MRRMVDVHKLFAFCNMKNHPLFKMIDPVDCYINLILHLKRTLSILPTLYQAVENGNADIFISAQDVSIPIQFLKVFIVLKNCKSFIHIRKFQYKVM